MKLSDIKAGDVVLVDNGFTCMFAGPKTVYEEEGTLYVNCAAGKHSLDSQQDSSGELIGIAFPEPVQ